MADLMVYKLYASVSTSTDSAASLDIVEDGQIIGMNLDIDATADDALNDGATAEVSFASVSAFATNDTRASIIAAGVHQGFLTTGGGAVAKSSLIAFGQDGIPVSGGERLYLHINITGTSVCAVRCYLYVKVTGVGRPSRRLL